MTDIEINPLLIELDFLYSELYSDYPMKACAKRILEIQEELSRDLCELAARRSENIP